MKSDRPQRIGDILGSLIKDSKLGRHLEQAQIWDRWPELAGIRLAAHGYPHAVRNDTLTIHVDSPVWMHRFALKKSDLIRRINGLCGHEIISDIFIALEPDEETGPPQADV